MKTRPLLRIHCPDNACGERVAIAPIDRDYRLVCPACRVQLRYRAAGCVLALVRGRK